MNMQDTLQLYTWLASNASLAEVENAQSTGLVGNIRFSENARRAYRLLWAWSAYRFEGNAGKAQDRFYNKCGREMFNRRIERARQMINNLTGQNQLTVDG